MREFGEPLPGISYHERPGAYAVLLNSIGNLAVVQTPQGLFLPGGGVEAGESLERALARELTEEIGYRVTHAEFVCEAAQYHWSEFYKQHFKKIGSFFRVEATAPAAPHLQAEHRLLWLSLSEARSQLSQEFQRWALGRF